MHSKYTECPGAVNLLRETARRHSRQRLLERPHLPDEIRSYSGFERERARDVQRKSNVRCAFIGTRRSGGAK